MDTRDELLRRVMNATTDLRHELSNQGVPEAELWEAMTVTDEADAVIVRFTFPQEEKPARKKKAD